MPSRRSHRKSTRRINRRILPVILAAGGLALILAIGGFSFAASQETHDSFCASCHTQPESTFYQRSTASKQVDLASFHKTKGTRCIDCHSGPGLFGRMSAELLGAHNALAWYTHTAVQPARLTVPIRDSACLKCHSDIPVRGAAQGGFGGEEGGNLNNHFHLFLSRWQSADPNAAGCVDCHSGHNTSVDPQQQFMNQADVEQVCQACHAVLRGD